MSITTKLAFTISPPPNPSFAGTDLVGESHEFHNTISGIQQKVVYSTHSRIEERLTAPLTLKPQQLSANAHLQLFQPDVSQVPHTFNPSIVWRYFLAVRMNC
jgi:hypothetical protein